VQAGLLELPLRAFNRARAAGFSLENWAFNTLSRVLPGTTNLRDIPPEKIQEIRSIWLELLDRDSRNIRQGQYPVSVLLPESPIAHLRRIPRLMMDGLRIHRQRRKGTATQFRTEAQERLDELPRYYRRNFHFQFDGYLSDESAELYEHQVEILFLGAADAMRRMVIAPLRERFGMSDGKGLSFLEIGCGTGRSTRFVKLAFPKARIVALDLSDPYLKNAKKSLQDLDRVDFLQGDGGHLPFQGSQFDGVFSVFLFHELPLEARRDVLAECRRVLKPGGIVSHVDSMQLGDRPSLDEPLKRFPQDFHEPFYRNYIENPMEDLVGEAGFANVKKDLGFFSKAVWGTLAKS
jgi:ubiquinone/menaquinone biosynthesis C-methylase UbiE